MNPLEELNALERQLKDLDDVQKGLKNAQSNVRQKRFRLRNAIISLKAAQLNESIKREEGA